MQLDLTYLRSDDRLLLSLRGKIDWLLTRSLVVRLVDAWVDKLQSTDLPDIGIPLGQRDIAAEHALSIEFDAPQRTDQAASPASQALLAEEVTLTVDAMGTRFMVKGGGQHMTLRLTRKESHLVLEMLAQKARAARWLEPVLWPDWLTRRA